MGAARKQAPHVNLEFQFLIASNEHLSGRARMTRMYVQYCSQELREHRLLSADICQLLNTENQIVSPHLLFSDHSVREHSYVGVCLLHKGAMVDHPHLRHRQLLQRHVRLHAGLLFPK